MCDNYYNDGNTKLKVTTSGHSVSVIKNTEGEECISQPNKGVSFSFRLSTPPARSFSTTVWPGRTLLRGAGPGMRGG